VVADAWFLLIVWRLLISLLIIHLAEEPDNHPEVAGTGFFPKEGLDLCQDHDNLAEADSV